MFEFITRLFKPKVEKTYAPVDVHTAPLSEDQLRLVTQTSVSHRPPQVMVASAQSSGKQRSHNEDSLFTLNALVSDGTGELPFGIFIVADGMGGHEHGEVASGIAVRASAQYLITKLYTALMGVHPEAQSESLQEIMEFAVRQAHNSVVREAPGGAEQH